MRMPRKIVSLVTSASLVLSLVPVPPSVAYAEDAKSEVEEYAVAQDEGSEEMPTVADELALQDNEGQGAALQAFENDVVEQEVATQDETPEDEPEIANSSVSSREDSVEDVTGVVAPDGSEPSGVGIDPNNLPDWMYEHHPEADMSQVEVVEPLAAGDKPADIVAAEQKITQAEQNLANQQAKWKRGSLGFFDSRGSHAASNLITGCHYASYNKIGDVEDATDLDNMKQALHWIGVGNQLRASLGLGQFKVTDALMACAQADANYSDTVIAHARQFNLWENVAWNYGSDPYYQWYDGEKALFDAAYKALTGSSNVPTGASAYNWYQSNRSACNSKLYELNPYGTEVGHYMNVINPNLTLTGFGVTTRRSMYGRITDAQVNHQYSTGSGAAYTQYSLSDYQAAFDSYYNGLKSSIKSAEQALSDAKAELEAVKATYKLENATIASIANKVYTGSQIKPTLTVTSGSKTLKAGTDYTVTYASNTNVGTATVTITGAGYYTGTKSATFKITARPISEATVAAIAKQTYKGSELKPAASVTYNGMTLKSGTDYTATYANNINAGTATVTLTGKGNYGGTKKVTFTIAPAPISSVKVTDLGSYAYTGKAISPTPTVTFGSHSLAKDTDYSIAYANNTKVGTATITLTGKGNYTGTKTATFAIVGSIQMFRLYNPNSGEHFYTADQAEKNNLVSVGWRYEGIGWTAPEKSKTPVYRLYNGVAGDHHYTKDPNEKDMLIGVGWRYEGIGWYSDDGKTVPLYRQYNPNAISGSHNYTTDKDENDFLVSVGWREEGIGWYGVK